MEPIDTHIGICPICGHDAVIFEDYASKEVIILCPDRFCPNCQDRYDD